MDPLLSSFLYLFLAIYVFVAAFLYFFQELIIFPQVVISRLSRRVNRKGCLPNGIESFFVKTEDGENLEVWTTHKSGEKLELAGIIFHGNGETVEKMNFLPFFLKAGIRAFTFDYRGTGLSSGWPSEEGLYKDSEAIYKAVIERTGLTADKIIILGNSLGSGPASYLASKIKPKGLILLSAYSDMKSVANKRLFYRFFSYVTRYSLPTSKYVSSLANTFVILAHGKKDSVITFDHIAIINQNIPDNCKKAVFESADSGHNDLYDNIEEDLLAKLKEFL